MSNKKKSSNKKDSQLLLRINRQERDAFISICEDMDTSAAREIRRFIKHYLADHKCLHTPESGDESAQT
ncbi:hypothetical protein ACODM8_00925 [Vibrio ostreicida]|uniref:CopG family transcriptional regulator n=1 Tax=Vibrio ostreicida TaxID=526588 RepID=A0ABT8BQM9_9VIBR|nr:hypothetical protein [Vibrio ostreicida]MDN3608998.1 hypothetical protein [Vibrio ostreicida]NPD07898.1 hypothetical protein [Vibrio ostreicida]